MRKWNFILSVLLLLGTVSCSQEELNHSGAGGGDLVRITLEAPQRIETRALGSNTNSASGGIDNVDWDLYDLRYQLAVYDETGAVQVIATEPKVVTGGYGPVTFEFRLIPGHTYKFVSWADFVTKGATDDLHYDTDDLTAVTIKSSSATQLNDESRDAYFITKDIHITSTFNETLTLKRPFSKLRVITTDWNYGNLPMPDNFKVTYYGCTRFEGINAVTGAAITSDGGTDGKTLDGTGEEFTTNISVSKDVKYYQTGYDADDKNRTLFVDYLFVNEEQQAIHFNLEMLDGTKSLISRDFTTNIPVQRNWLTTILGNLLTTKGNVTVSIDDKFTNEHSVNWWENSSFTPSAPTVINDTYHIAKPEEFMWLVDNVSDVVGKTVVLDADIDMNGTDWKPIYIGDYNKYIFDGQGHTIRNINVNGKYGAVQESLGGLIKTPAYIGVFGRFAGEMKNVTFENIVINGLADSVVDTGEDGNPVDHSKETAYFAGVIGHAGQNWPVFENVHVKNITIKASSGKRASSVGGLVGFSGSQASFTNCTVKDANLIGYETGGLIGKALDKNVLTNCSTENITIRIRPLGTTYVSGVVGKIDNGEGTEFNSCTAPTNLILLNDTDGSISEYAPANNLYGGCPTNDNLIQIQ
ncbi:DUF6562 domain-containing protein [Phocaeicola sp.]